MKRIITLKLHPNGGIMRLSVNSHNRSLLQRLIGIAAALLVVLSFAPEVSAQPCPNSCPTTQWVDSDSVFYEISPGCYIVVLYRWRVCGILPDWVYDVYINKICLFTECNECETAFNAKSISGLLTDARLLVTGTTNALDLDPGDLTIAWSKCWERTGNCWEGCSTLCCTREILNWSEGNNGTTTTSDAGTCSSPCVDVCP